MNVVEQTTVIGMPYVLTQLEVSTAAAVLASQEMEGTAMVMK